MAKYYGTIGFFSTSETSPGIWEEEIIERKYFGDIQTDRRRFPAGMSTNNDLELSMTLSVIMDDYAATNFFAIKYVTWQGAAWSVTDVHPEPPRLVINIGGVYNGD